MQGGEGGVAPFLAQQGGPARACSLRRGCCRLREQKLKSTSWLTLSFTHERADQLPWNIWTKNSSLRYSQRFSHRILGRYAASRLICLLRVTRGSFNHSSSALERRHNSALLGYAPRCWSSGSRIQIFHRSSYGVSLMHICALPQYTEPRFCIHVTDVFHVCPQTNIMSHTSERAWIRDV